MGNGSSSDSDSERDIWDVEFDSGQDSDCSDESEKECRKRKRKERRQAKSPSPKHKKIEMKYCDSEDDSDEENNGYCSYYNCNFTDRRSFIKIYCDWSIDGFVDPSVHDFFFIMEKMVGEGDTHWGIYVNILSNIRSEATVNFKSYVVNHKNETVYLNKSKDAKFPTKTGYRFLGSINKARYIDDDYYQCSYMGEGSLNFRFKIEVTYKNCQIYTDLEKIFSQEKEKDITLTVKGNKFKANRKILIDRSPTFAKLLENEHINKLKIDDIEPDMLKQLLIFIYTNKIPKLMSLTGKLSIVADRYKIKDLQIMCKKFQAAKKLNSQLK
ncbi:protein roadkill-like isoform X2 [Phymastichus coffea]|uniref:protein roadkill-like isoform X2 n=1 Tax=Phymastichus coffea TaxID=108790 RepID=UPI00273B7EBF|nr:protein roadkill-like isoform X2 [Phymastichus coffea]